MTDSDWVQGNASFFDSPASSNSGKTFTLDPSDNLSSFTRSLFAKNADSKGRRKATKTNN